MDMYQKRKIRAEKKNNNQEDKLTKVVLNWLITIQTRPTPKPYNVRKNLKIDFACFIYKYAKIGKNK